MSAADLTAMLPLVILLVTSCAALLGIAARRSSAFSFRIAAAGTAAAIVSLAASAGLYRSISILLVIDDISIFFATIILSATLVVLLISRGYRGFGESPSGEFYVLVLLASFGAITLTWSAHFVTVFLGLEVLSISLYALVAYAREKEICLEAGIKYLGLASVSTSFLLFGLALLFASTGSLEIGPVAGRLAEAEPGPLAVSGLAMTLAGLAFKLALAPFHMWAPDVYEGSPAPATAFIATVSKGSVIAVLLRLFTPHGLLDSVPVFGFFLFLSVASMFVGNLLALYQSKVKRMLACSSIAHMGYILVAFLAAGAMRFQAVAFYLVIYFIMSLGAFGAIAFLTGSSARDMDSFDDFRGLYRSRPWMAVFVTIMVLSLAGMPVTAGFFAKFFIVAAGVGSSLWLLVIIMIVNSGIGLFYYLRLITAMYGTGPEGAAIGAYEGREGRVVLGVLLALLVWWGLYPAPLLNWIARFTPGF